MTLFHFTDSTKDLHLIDFFSAFQDLAHVEWSLYLAKTLKDGLRIVSLAANTGC